MFHQNLCYIFYFQSCQVTPHCSIMNFNCIPDLNLYEKIIIFKMKGRYKDLTENSLVKLQ